MYIYTIHARGEAPGGPQTKSTRDTFGAEVVFLLGVASRAPPIAPRGPQLTPQTVQEGSKSSNDRSKTPKGGRQRAQDAFKTPREATERPPKRAAGGPPEAISH
eukprot:2458313-Pyramimonas_sp.AAC.2